MTTRKLKPITVEQMADLDLAILALKQARARCRSAGAFRASDYIARALKSVEGARRHAEHRLRYGEKPCPVIS